MGASKADTGTGVAERQGRLVIDEAVELDDEAIRLLRLGQQR